MDNPYIIINKGNPSERGEKMKNKKRELITNIAEKFVNLSENEKSFIAGYMAGKQDLLFEIKEESNKKNKAN